MAKLEWDKTGERYYETGTSKGVIYVQDDKGEYGKGVAWNGLTGVTESPSGADANDIYADDMKYASLRSAETFGATIEAYTYPKEFAECDGSKEIAPGVMIGQQARKAFGFTYRTKVSNDVNLEAYKLHVVYGATVTPSDKGYTTINDSPDAITFSWEMTTQPVNVDGYKPTAILTIDSRDANAGKLAELEAKLYGTDTEEPTLPLPDEIKKIFGDSSVEETVAIAG